MNLDRWEDQFRDDHPRAYHALEWFVAGAMVALILVYCLWLAVPEVPAT
jgi:hypothetical protein